LDNRETPQYFEEEHLIPFVPCRPPFLVPMWVPLGDDVKVGRNENQTNDMSIQPPSNSYDPYHVGENLECFINCMGPKVKVDPLGFQDHINVHKSNFEPNPNENLTIFGDTLKPLSPMFGDSLVSPT